MLLSILWLPLGASAWTRGGAVAVTRGSALAAQKQEDMTAVFRDAIAKHEDGSFAATPIKKQRVTVCGCGGKAGAVVFGAVQRAAQLFDAGLAPPRALVGAARGSRKLNACLATSYVLAFAGEDLVRRCDFRDVAQIEKLLEGSSVVVAPARLRPQGAVTGTEWSWDLDLGGDADAFANVVAAAKAVGAKVVCVAAPADVEAASAALGDAPHLLLVTNELAETRAWNLNKGITQVVGAKTGGDAAGDLQVEDLGAVISQACCILDAGASATLSLGALAEAGALGQAELHAAVNAALRAPMA